MDLQGRILANRVVLGRRTDAAPAAALVGNVPYVFAAIKGSTATFISTGEISADRTSAGSATDRFRANVASLAAQLREERVA